MVNGGNYGIRFMSPPREPPMRKPRPIRHRVTTVSFSNCIQKRWNFFGMVICNLAMAISYEFDNNQNGRWLSDLTYLVAGYHGVVGRLLVDLDAAKSGRKDLMQ